MMLRALWVALVAVVLFAGPVHAQVEGGPSDSPVPIPDLTTLGRSVLVEVQFSDRETATVVRTAIGLTRPGTSVGAPPILRIDSCDESGAVFATQQEWHPMWARVYGDEGESLEITPDIPVVLTIPFAPQLAEVRLRDMASDTEVLVADVKQIVVDFCTANPTDAACQVMTPGCADPTGDGVSAVDALLVLQAAVGTEICALCICDTDGDDTITATDALRALSFAVGLPVELSCTACP